MPLCKNLDLQLIRPLIIVHNVADDGGTVLVLHNRVLLMSGSAVIGQCEQEGAEHTALEGSGSCDSKLRTSPVKLYFLR